MKTTYTEAYPTKNSGFPIFCRCIKLNDPFYNGIVVFQDVKTFTVLHVPNNKPKTRLKFGEVVSDDYVVSPFSEEYWKILTSGTITIEI